MSAVGPRLAAWLVGILICGTTFFSLCCAAEKSDAPFRIGFIGSMFSDVNENDAKAAVKVWGALIANEQNIPTSPDPAIFKDIEAVRRSLREKKVDAVGITLIEYAQLLPEISFSPIFLTYNAGSLTERYVLLTHRDGPIKKLADLGGRSLYMHTNPRACLAPLWLDDLLMQQGHPTAARLIGKIVKESKLAKVLLPVFFHQADACVVTRNGFDTMSELNPQISRQLVVLAESSAMVPAVFAFRADYNPSFKEKLIAGINALKTTPAGRQVLTIFHSEDIEVQAESHLDTALKLIATRAGLAL
jgi:ABC-type phosphate/phosphonate transport system substrate-binding protein